HGLEILDRRCRDRADQRRREAPIVRHLVLEEIIDALGRQPDRIDHAAFDLGGARRRIAGAVFAGDGFRHHGTQPVDVHHLGEVGGEAAGARHDRVLQRHRPDLDTHVYHPTASCMSNTGPSMQTRRNSFLPLTSKARTQTERGASPHASTCSIATWPGILCALPTRFISWNSRFAPQVKNASPRFCAINRSRIFSTFSTALEPSVSSTLTTSPASANSAPAMTKSLSRAERIAVTPTPFS